MTSAETRLVDIVMTTRTTCHRCGAPYGDEPPLYCRSCHAKQALGVADLDAYRANPERFELVPRHPAFAAAMRWAPRLRAYHELGAPVAMWLYITAFTGTIVLLLGSLAPSDRFALPFYAVSALMFLVATLEVVRAAVPLWGRRHNLVAVVAEDVVSRRHGGSHLITLRTADGAAREVIATGGQLGMIVLTDIGVAYLQGKRLVDFRVIDVMPAPLDDHEPRRPPCCAVCAAPYTFASRATCAFCAAPLDHPELGEHGARFARARATLAAGAVPGGVDQLPPITGAVVMLGIAAFLLYGLWVMRYLWFFFAEDLPWGLVSLVPIVGFVGFAVIFGRRRLAPRVARPTDELVLVVRERRASWMAVNDQPVWEYYVTIAGPGGGRIELRAMPPIARAVAAGQLVLARRRHGWLARTEVVPEG